MSHLQAGHSLSTLRDAVPQVLMSVLIVVCYMHESSKPRIPPLQERASHLQTRQSLATLRDTVPQLMMGVLIVVFYIDHKDHEHDLA